MRMDVRTVDPVRARESKGRAPQQRGETEMQCNERGHAKRHGCSRCTEMRWEEGTGERRGNERRLCTLRGC
jgi:hypothetical protein